MGEGEKGWSASFQNSAAPNLMECPSGAEPGDRWLDRQREGLGVPPRGADTTPTPRWA